MAATLEEMFYREFTQMMSQRKASTGMFNLYDLDLPDGLFGEIQTREMCLIRGISEEYYSSLNNTEAMIWSHGKLSRRKFDHNGEFILDKNGKNVLEPVTLPHESIAIVSDVMIGVPNKFKSKESFEYVDMIHRTNKDGNNEIKYVYIVPRDYCYKLNQTALVLSLTKLRSYYYGSSVCLQNGYTLYMYVIPYKPSTRIERSYRIIATDTYLDNYQPKIDALIQYWYGKQYLFNYEDCQMYEGIKGRTNAAYEVFPIVKDTFERYSEDRSMAKVEDVQEMWEENLDYVEDSPENE